MKKNKIIIPLFGIIALGFIYWKQTQNKKVVFINKAQTKIEKIKKLQKRIPAAIKKKKPLIINNREVITSSKNVKKFEKKELKIAKTPNKKWKKLVIEKLSQTTHKNVSIKVKKIKSIIYVKHNIGKYAEHVVVQLYDKERSVRSSFQAYVDSDSGKIIQSWSPTRFENYKVSQLPKLKVETP